MGELSLTHFEVRRGAKSLNRRDNSADNVKPIN